MASARLEMLTSTTLEDMSTLSHTERLSGLRVPCVRKMSSNENSVSFESFHTGGSSRRSSYAGSYRIKMWPKSDSISYKSYARSLSPLAPSIGAQISAMRAHRGEIVRALCCSLFTCKGVWIAGNFTVMGLNIIVLCVLTSTGTCDTGSITLVIFYLSVYIFCLVMLYVVLLVVQVACLAMGCGSSLDNEEEMA